jgi:endoglucanase
MKKDRLKFLEALVEAAGPSGYEEPVARVWRQRLADVADIETDVMGSVFATINPKGSPKVMLSGHIDELGLQVSFVSEKGFLYVNAIGGHDRTVIPGRRVWVHTAKGRVAAVTGKRAIHMQTAEERTKVPELHELWIDIGARSREEALEVVELGDPVTYDVGFSLLRGSMATSRAFDNKLGAFVIAEALCELASRKKLQACIVAVATTQEEIGLHGATTGAFRVDPDLALAVDVTNPTDYPTTSKEKYGDISLGKGPTITRGANCNPVVVRGLIDTAKSRKIAVQIEPEPGRTGTDAGAIQLARRGVACGLLGIPLRYMHTPSEVVDLDDVERCIDLVVAYCRSLEASVSFVPM